MTSIKVLIVEDKSVIAESLKVLLQKFGMSVIAICKSGEDAIEVAKTHEPDLVLMDIELAGAMDGISTAQVISKEQNLAIIYLTDFSDDKIVQRAKLTHPASYITKPFNEADLVRAIEIAVYNSNRLNAENFQKRKIIFLRVDAQKFTKVDLDQILYIKANRAYCSLVTEEGVKVLTTNMSHVHEQIANSLFLQVHRSFVVNMEKVTGVDGNTIKLGKHEVQMGGEYREDFMKNVKIIR